MSPTPVSFFALPGIPLIEPGDDLAAILAKALVESEVGLRDGDVLVVAQKIVSKAEGRYVKLDDVKPSPAPSRSRDARARTPGVSRSFSPSRTRS